MTGSARAKNRKKLYTVYCFFENKVHFYPILLVNTKTTIPLARYIPRRHYSSPL